MPSILKVDYEGERRQKEKRKKKRQTDLEQARVSRKRNFTSFIVNILKKKVLAHTWYI